MASFCAASATGQDLQPLPNSGAGLPPSAPQSLATVNGVVLDAATNQPLARALVRLEGDADAGALTDGEGRFEFADVPVGPQLFEVRKPGYLDQPAALPGMDADGHDLPHNVMVAEGMAPLRFTLTPTGSIHGRVDLSTGDAGQGISINLLRRTIEDGRAYWQHSGATRTNSEGEFRFAGLAAGSYALYTDPAMESEPASSENAPGAVVERSGFASVFYPEAHDLAGAAKIHLGAGQTAQANLMLRLEPFHTVTATLAQRGRGRQGSQNVILDAAGHQLPYPTQLDAATNTIKADLPDGNYTLLVWMLQTRNGLVDSFDTVPVTGAMVGSADFAVAGRPVRNLRIPLSPVGAATVQLNVLHSPTAHSSSQTALFGPYIVGVQTGGWVADGLGASLAEQIKPGANAARPLMPGNYWVGGGALGSDLCGQSLTAGGVDLAREPLRVGLNGAMPPIELTLRDDCASLALNLPQTLLPFTPGEEPSYSVYVLPQFDSTGFVIPQTLRPSSGGGVTVAGLTPGTYRVYTFAAPVNLEYRNPAAMAALPVTGQEVTLSAGATSSLTVEVPER